VCLTLAIAYSCGQYSVVPVKVGEIKVCKAELTYLVDFEKWFFAPVFVFVIISAAYPKKVILVDAGFDSGFKDPGRLKGNKELFASSITNVLNPENVESIVLTHLHNDHSSFLTHFPKARIYIQKSEIAFAYKPDPMQRPYYDSKILDQLARANYEELNGSFDLEDGITLIPTPGHTPGSQVVLINSDHQSLVITGDTVPMFHNWEPSDPKFGTPKEVEKIPPGIHTSLENWYRSVKVISSHTRTIIPSHDPLVSNQRITQTSQIK
jgi:N-acyl homoserine lactone hydrolase